MLNKEEAVEYLMDRLNYAYCDNCLGNEVGDEDYCDDCHRKYQNWALGKAVAEQIVNNIYKD